MANPQLDPTQAAELHITDMLCQSHLLTNMEAPPPVPHLTATSVDYHAGAEDSLIRDWIAIIPSDPDQLQDLADWKMFD